MIDKESKNHLIAYRVEQAKLTAREAAILLQNNMLRGAMNRIYYACSLCYRHFP